MKIKYFTFDQIVKHIGPSDNDIILWESKKEYGPIENFDDFIAEKEEDYFFHYNAEPFDIKRILENNKIWLREFCLPEWIDKKSSDDNDPGPDILHRVWEGIEVVE